MGRDIVHAIQIDNDPKSVFDTIATKDGLASFWTGDVQGEDQAGGEMSFGFAGAPVRLPMRTVRLDAPAAVEWECPGGFPFWEHTTVSWSIEDLDGHARVIFRHLGFPDAMPEFDFGSVSLTWALIVARLKEVVESGGTPNPALP
jgi:uncharacterized protein YndB with AHSA1/START domain